MMEVEDQVSMARTDDDGGRGPKKCLWPGQMMMEVEDQVSMALKDED